MLPGILLAAFLLGASCFAQDADEEIEIAEVPQAVQPQPAPPATAPAAAQTPEEKRLAEFLALKFDRTPAAILQAQGALATPPTPAPKEIELFRLQVVASRWKEAGAFLKTLPEKDAAKLYESVLKDLARVPIDPAMQQAQQQGGPVPSPTLLQHDVADLGDIAPKEVTDEQLKLLGALLRRVLAATAFLDPLLARLDAGTAQLGGTDPRKREQAAQLLLNANRDLDAARFLAPLEAGKETASFPLLEKHVRCAFTKGRVETKKESIARAWILNQIMLASAQCPADFRERASLRSGELLPFLPLAEATKWLQQIFSTQPAEAFKMLTSVGQQVASGRAGREIDQRKKNLELQRQAVDALLPATEQRAQWQAALNLFATNWMEEADYAKKMHQPPQRQTQYQRDMYGNMYYGNQQSARNYNPNQLPPLPLADVLPGAPDAAWLAAIDPSLRPRALTVLAGVHLKLEDDAKALPFIEQIATVQPKEALQMSNELLRVWATARDPDRGMQQQNRRIYYNPYGNMQQGIPLTRALQQRSLEELSAVLKRLRALPIEALDDSAIVTAFNAAHSPAEVYREEAIELVLEKVADIKPETLAQLLQGMRERLAGQWRKPNVQQQAKTQRTDAQIDAEVLSGYELLAGLIGKGLAGQPDDWRLNLTQAATLFDWAEFQYGKKVDLAIYVAKREKAFEAFQRAADLYAGKLVALEKKDESPLVYQMWLNANLGASDLAMVTRQQEPSMDQLDRVRAAMLALPGEAAGRHFDLLAKAVDESAGNIPANLKPRYMSAALRIIGERPAAAEIRKLVAYHEGLLREIELSVRVDGDASVGHGKAFGVFFTVRHTAELERENAGGFGKYLRNQSQGGYYNPYGTPPVDYRDDLEKQMREKLSEGFEIVSIIFHDEKVQSRGYGRAGWRETPLVYLLLKAKDASVDRLPALRLDVDFADKQGPVVLPVESAIQMIDARGDAPPARPVSEMEVTQTLDDRALKQGKLSLEVKTTARGLLPDFKELFEFAPAGFKIDETEDSGPAVQRLDGEKDDLVAVSERNWVVKMSADRSTLGKAQFAFPKPRRAEMKVAYKRYVDADVAEATPELALSGLPVNKARLWMWGLMAAGTVAGAALLARRLQAGAADAEAKAVYELPAAVTPFNALHLLRAMHGDERLAFSKEQRGELSEAIAGIEAHYFAPARNGTAAPDLETVGKHWVGMAAR